MWSLPCHGWNITTANSSGSCPVVHGAAKPRKPTLTQPSITVISAECDLWQHRTRKKTLNTSMLTACFHGQIVPNTSSKSHCTSVELRMIVICWYIVWSSVDCETRLIKKMKIHLKTQFLKSNSKPSMHSDHGAMLTSGEMVKWWNG